MYIIDMKQTALETEFHKIQLYATQIDIHAKFIYLFFLERLTLLHLDLQLAKMNNREQKFEFKVTVHYGLWAKCIQFTQVHKGVHLDPFIFEYFSVGI